MKMKIPVSVRFSLHKHCTQGIRYQFIKATIYPATVSPESHRIFRNARSRQVHGLCQVHCKKIVYVKVMLCQVHDKSVLADLDHQGKDYRTTTDYWLPLRHEYYNNNQRHCGLKCIIIGNFTVQRSTMSSISMEACIMMVFSLLCPPPSFPLFPYLQ